MITISSTKQKRNFQMTWLTEFPWLALDADLDITNCKICCKWANVCDPKSALGMGSHKFRKHPLYAHARSMNNAACVMRNDSSNKPIKDMPIAKAVVSLQKEQHHKLKSLFNTAYAIAKNCHPKIVFICLLTLDYAKWFLPDFYHP